jgi:hypothetical protein
VTIGSNGRVETIVRCLAWENLREDTKRAAESRTRKVASRLTPGEKPNRKRLAQVAIASRRSSPAKAEATSRTIRALLTHPWVPFPG